MQQYYNRNRHQKCLFFFAALTVPPKDTTVIVEPPGVILEGTPIILLCHSQAKPPVHNYSWSINGGEYLVIGDLLTLDPAQPRHTGEYRCMAKNAVGEEASPVVHLDVQCKFVGRH